MNQSMQGMAKGERGDLCADDSCWRPLVLGLVLLAGKVSGHSEKKLSRSGPGDRLYPGSSAGSLFGSGGARGGTAEPPGQRFPGCPGGGLAEGCPDRAGSAAPLGNSAAAKWRADWQMEEEIASHLQALQQAVWARNQQAVLQGG